MSENYYYYYLLYFSMHTQILNKTITHRTTGMVKSNDLRVRNNYIGMVNPTKKIDKLLTYDFIEYFYIDNICNYNICIT